MIAIFNSLYSKFELNRNRKNFKQQMVAQLDNEDAATADAVKEA